MYGKDIYGKQQYSGQPGTDADPEEYFVDLSRYAPPFLANIREIAGAYRAQGYEVGRLQYGLGDLLRQSFVSTATWGLARWEKTYGIATNLSLTYEQRREIILAKLRGQGTTTRQMIEDTAAAFSGGEVKVIEDNQNHRFIIRFVGIKGIPRNMQAFIRMLEDIKPAHLAYVFEYRYTVWSGLSSYSWSSLGGMKWESIRILKEA